MSSHINFEDAILIAPRCVMAVSRDGGSSSMIARRGGGGGVVLEMVNKR